MITGEPKVDYKITQLLTSGIKENVDLAMTICREKHPAIYAALLNFTGYGELTQEIYQQISTDCNYNVGTVVKYRGMDGCPNMVITEANLVQVASNLPVYVRTKYYTKITAKYYNKSSQTFHKIEDRLECFEIVNK